MAQFLLMIVEDSKAICKMSILSTPGQILEQTIKPIVWEHLEKKAGGTEKGGVPKNHVRQPLFCSAF